MHETNIFHISQNNPDWNDFRSYLKENISFGSVLQTIKTLSFEALLNLVTRLPYLNGHNVYIYETCDFVFLCNLVTP